MAKQFAVRYSASKGERIAINKMHPLHILNAMRKDVKNGRKEFINDYLIALASLV